MLNYRKFANFYLGNQAPQTMGVIYFWNQHSIGYHGIFLSPTRFPKLDRALGQPWKSHICSIQSRRSGTLTKSESLQIVGRKSWTMMIFILKNSCCCFWINSCIKNHYFNTAHELFQQPSITRLYCWTILYVIC